MKKIKTTHVGSLPRPPEMMTKVLRRQPVDDHDLKRYLTEIMEKQFQLGIDYINNGELPRSDYVNATAARISGFDDTGIAPMPRDLEEVPELSRRFGSQNGLITLNPKAPVKLPACSRPLKYTGEASLRRELDMMAEVYHTLKLSYPKADPKLFFTAPSPGTIALFFENKYYPSDEEYLEHLSEILKKEYEIIAGYGFHLQLDCPDLAMGRHTRFKDLADDDFLERIDVHVRVLNQAMASIDPEQCRAHICWGNYPGPHHCDVGLEKILKPVSNIHARFISLEAANAGHSHEWEVFGRLDFPEDKVLMPGVIDTSINAVEHPDLVAQRISRFVDFLGPDRVIASTDCGFATTASATSVSGEVAWMKLAALVEGAKRAVR